MKLGVNLTRYDQIEFFNQFYIEGKIDFVEILLDNFINFDPAYIASKLEKFPVSFHIMNSRYLERSLEELQYTANRITEFSKVFNPIYISDHLFINTINNIYYPMQIECNYHNDILFLHKKINEWSTLLDSPIYIENFPSVFEMGIYQIPFFEEIIKDESINILFDFSNAIIATLNNNIDFEVWERLILSTSHFHLSGYRKTKGIEKIILDTHDTRISNLSKSYIEKFKEHLKIDGSTLVLEYDNRISYTDWINDINKLRNVLS